MTLRLRVGVPHIPFLDVLLLFNDKIRAPIIHLDSSRYRQKAFTWLPKEARTTPLPSRFVYASTTRDLKVAEAQIVRSGTPYVILLGGNAIDVHQHRVPVFPKAYIDEDDVAYMADLTALPEIIYEPLSKQFDAATEVYSTLAQPSILQTVHTLFYRIQDKSQRLKCQEQVYRYLSGSLARPPMSGVAKLDAIVNSVEARSLREAVIEGSSLDKEQQEELDYDVRYVLAKVDKLR